MSGNDETPLDLPELNMATIDRATLDQLCADVTACTELLDVLVKGGAEVRAEEAPVTLAAARDRLLDGSVRAIQLRYRYQDAEWRDTIIAGGDGFKLCRIRLEFG